MGKWKDNITIIILDNETNQPRYYNFKGFVKRIVIWGLAIVLALGVGVSVTLFYLQQQIGELTGTKAELEQKNRELLKRTSLLEAQILQQEERYSTLQEKVREIEQILGYKEVNHTNELREYEDQGELNLSGQIGVEEGNLQGLLERLKKKSLQQKIWLTYIPNGKPTRYKKITSRFGIRRNPIYHRREFHKGLDMAARVGTPVVATADGLVVSAIRSRRGYGNVVIIQHNFGFTTLYGHLHSIAVEPGEYVRKGQKIGTVGNSGLSTAPHLHYEVRFLARPFNPYPFVRWNQRNFVTIFKKVRGIPWQSLEGMMERMFQLLKRLPSSQKGPESSENSK